MIADLYVRFRTKADIPSSLQRPQYALFLISRGIIDLTSVARQIRVCVLMSFGEQNMSRRRVRTKPERLPSSARWLGLAGLIPQILLAAVVIGGPSEFIPAARGLALAYGALILSFIGGAWWGLASRPQANVHSMIWLAAVAPSLIAFAAIGVWAIGFSPEASLLAIGASLIGTPSIDYKLAANGVSPPGWLRFRARLSLVLGGLTILIAVWS
ncbi:MAG: DUF3429 domain-containing protein [Sphingomicrobium sp.]